MTRKTLRDFDLPAREGIATIAYDRLGRVGQISAIVAVKDGKFHILNYVETVGITRLLGNSITMGSGYQLRIIGPDKEKSILGRPRIVTLPYLQMYGPRGRLIVVGQDLAKSWLEDGSGVLGPSLTTLKIK